MRGAFIVRLAPETEPTQGRVEGWVEEVDSGVEVKFRSGEELLTFLSQRVEAIFPTRVCTAQSNTPENDQD